MLFFIFKINRMYLIIMIRGRDEGGLLKLTTDELRVNCEVLPSSARRTYSRVKLDEQGLRNTTNTYSSYMGEDTRKEWFSIELQWGSPFNGCPIDNKLTRA